MIMKTISYVLMVLLIVALSSVAVFYFNSFKPMAADYARLKEGLPSLEKAKSDLKQYRDKESKEMAWLSPAVDVLSSGLTNEIKSGKAEVLTSGNRVVVNIAEDVLYVPGTSIFSKESPRLRQTLASLLQKNELKGKHYIIGNTTESVLPQGRGRHKVRAKDGRSLAAERSLALIKDFEKNGVNQDVLIAAAYSSKQPEIAFNLKSGKTVIIIENPLVAKQAQPFQQAQSKQTATTVVPEVNQQPQPQPIPIKPAQPKAH
jgi:hypothetical protein